MEKAKVNQNATVLIPNGTDLNDLPKEEINKTKRTRKGTDFLQPLLDAEKLLNERSKKDIVWSPPIVSRFDVPIIRQGTINVIQGKFGVHKSRLAEMFCSLLLQKKSIYGMLDFKKYAYSSYTVCLVDTERNLKEELPNAIELAKSEILDIKNK